MVLAVVLSLFIFFCASRPVPSFSVESWNGTFPRLFLNHFSSMFWPQQIVRPFCFLFCSYFLYYLRNEAVVDR